MNKNGYLKLWPVLLLTLLMVGGWMTVRYQAEAAMSREDAYQTFWTIEAQNRFEDGLGGKLNRINDKLDRILERKQ